MLPGRLYQVRHIDRGSKLIRSWRARTVRGFLAQGRGQRFTVGIMLLGHGLSTDLEIVMAFPVANAEVLSDEGPGTSWPVTFEDFLWVVCSLS